jgi:sugar phosphate isomerase/epimerase
MQIGISSPAFCNDDFEMRLKSVAEHFTLWEIVADIEQFLPDIRDKLETLGPSYDLKYAVHAPFNDLNIAAFNPTVREYSMKTIKKCMTVAHELGLRTFSLHPGHFCPAGLYAPEKVHELSRGSIKELDKFASTLDLDISLENMPIPNWTLCTKKSELMEYINETDFKICFDIGHAHINGQISEFLTVKDLFGNIHIHDNNGKRDQHRVIGSESVPFQDFLDELVSNYSGNIIIESNNLEDGIESYNILKSMIKQS